jgi:hypothetical protein
MLRTEINADDLNQLKHFRVERFHCFFASILRRCIIRVDDANVLIVQCPHAGIVDEFLNNSDDLCNHAWMILGVRYIAVYFCQEEVLLMSTVRHK